MDDFFRAAPREQKLHEKRKQAKIEESERIKSEREIKPIESGTKRKFEFGDKGASWRMMKLQRVFDSAREERKDVEQVALDRYGSLEEFQEAIQEREFLDKKLPEKDRPKRDNYRSVLSKSQFKAPTKPNEIKVAPKISKVPSVIVQQQPKRVADVLSTDELNSMYAQVLKAQLMKASNFAELQDNYLYEKARAEAVDQEVRVLPTIDSQGQLLSYDGKDRKEKQVQPHKQETHDRQGNRLGNVNESEKTLDDLVREEKMNKSYSYDKDIAHQIQSDNQFNDTVDYMEESSDLLSRRKEQTLQKQQKYAMKDQRRTDKALDECSYCTHDGRPPRVSIVAKGIKIYLALPETIDMITYHCLIVPVEHVLTTLELEDDAWDEIRNFQKCLIRMAESKGMGMIFMETVVDLKKHRHTVIECIPVPLEVLGDVPAYFKESLLACESEWSQHQKVIVTDKGFRRSLVKNLPYFHVWFDPNRGVGHVIEEAADWEPWFGRQVIASILDLAPDKWRRPKLLPLNEVAQRAKTFYHAFEPFDWTKML